MKPRQRWTVYIVECRDGKLYTGITCDLARRLKQHNSGNGCRFTKYRAPVTLRYHEQAKNRPAALVREAAIKRMARPRKCALCNR